MCSVHSLMCIFLMCSGIRLIGSSFWVGYCLHVLLILSSTVLTAEFTWPRNSVVTQVVLLSLEQQKISIELQGNMVEA